MNQDRISIRFMDGLKHPLCFCHHATLKEWGFSYMTSPFLKHLSHKKDAKLYQLPWKCRFATQKMMITHRTKNHEGTLRRNQVLYTALHSFTQPNFSLSMDVGMIKLNWLLCHPQHMHIGHAWTVYGGKETIPPVRQ